jgi:hypothetical protein
MAMGLLAVLVVVPAGAALVMSLRCAVFFIVECLDRPWVRFFHDYLDSTIPVLVAIIMRNAPPPARPPE